MPAGLESDYLPPRIARWTLALLALVAFDSAVFYHIQHTPSLKESTWSGSAQLFVNASSHLLAGLFAGMALDRSWASAATRVAVALLVVATMLILSGQGSGGTVLYTAGVSIYSAVLVYYPARSGRLGLAAWIYAAAGWAGSALGIGAVEQMGSIPAWWLVITPLTVIGALWFRARNVQ
jgi:cytochrome c oxidase cbb3-type subunit 2